MRSIISIAAALTIITTLTACSSGTQSESSASTPSQAETEVVTDETTGSTLTIDPFEALTINTEDNTLDISLITDENNHYPSGMMMKLDYSDEAYSKDILYDATIISADDKTIQIKVDAEIKPEQADNYSLSTASKTYEIKVSDIPSHLLNKEMLTPEIFDQLDAECRNRLNDPSSMTNLENSLFNGLSDMSGTSDDTATASDDSIELVAVYGSLPAKTDFLSDKKVIEDGEFIDFKANATGIPFVDDPTVSDSYRLFYIYKLAENDYSIISACPVFLNDKLLLDHTTFRTTEFGLETNSFDSEEAAFSGILEWFSNYKAMLVEITQQNTDS